MNQYKCSDCREKKDKPFVCFLEGDKTIGVPVFDNQKNMVGHEEREGVNAEEFMYILADIRQEMKNDPPLFEVLQIYYKSICPLSIIDQSFDLVLLWETYASEYGKFPYDGGLLDQPNVLIEAFLTVMATRNEYERIREEKVKKEINKDQKSMERRALGNKGLRL